MENSLHHGRKPALAGATHQQRRTAAEELAIAALGFIGGNPERLAKFLGATGIGPDSIRAAAGEPGFLVGVLDHLSEDEPLILEFAAEHAMDPNEVIRARDTLAQSFGERLRDIP